MEKGWNMKEKILIVEDDNDINEIIRKSLNIKGFNTYQAYSGTEALIYLKKDIDLVILDLMLPGLSGEDLILRIKESKDLPILVLSAKDSMDSKLKLLNGGASDYMTKPFNIDELIARVKILLKNGRKLRENMGTLKYKDLEIDENTYGVYVGGKSIKLTKSEFNILKLFLENPKKVFTKNQIYEHIFDEYSYENDNSINVHISNLRKKIQKYSKEKYIETVWGVGYILSK